MDINLVAPPHGEIVVVGQAALMGCHHRNYQNKVKGQRRTQTSEQKWLITDVP